jgi:hypothetical protein
MILVVYSSFGLVVRGLINLEVFNILYWVMFVTYFAIFFVIYSPALGRTEYEGMGLKTSMFSAKQWRVINFFIALDWILIVISEKMKKKSIRRQCINMTHYAALGGTRRRNMFNHAETKNYFYAIVTILILQDFILTMSMEEEILFRKAAANIIWSLILIFNFSLFLPISHLAKSFERFPEFWIKYQEHNSTEFYVRTPLLEPRREPVPELGIKPTELECEAGCSYANKKQKRKKRSNSLRRKRFNEYKGHLHTIIEMSDIDI